MILDNFKKAITSLNDTLNLALDEAYMSKQSDIARNAIKAGVIQNFEFTYELCWKFIQRWLEDNFGKQYIDGVSRKELFRIAAEKQLIKDAKKWFQYHEARNLTVHTYNITTSDSVFNTAKLFIIDAKALLVTLEKIK